MSSVKLTKAQQEAISLRDKNIIVSAQAGAGKTHILVERIVDLLDEYRINISEMLIVTFTNKAAAEMKERIKSRLLERIESSEDEDKIFFLKQYNLTNTANISTMHAFCIDILRDYFYKLGIDPGFRLVKDSTVDLMKWQSINEVFDRYYKSNDAAFHNLLSNYSRRYTDLELINILFDIYRFIQSQINPFEWLNKNIKRYKYYEYYENEENLKELEQEIYDFYTEDIDELIKTYDEASVEINNLINETNCPAYSVNIESDSQIIERLRSIDNLQDLIEFIPFIEFSRLSVGTGVNKEFGKDLTEIFKNLINSYRDIMKNYFGNFSVDIVDEIKLQDQIRYNLDNIYNILKDFDKEFKIEKKKKNVLDFNDLEHLTIDLLEDEEVVQELKSRFRFIFFDEYQDANQVQDFIIDKISRENNLFFVGDIKQSIYKFRLADPILFKNRYAKYSIETKNNRIIDLSHNFRSEDILLKFNNMLFNQLMTEELGDVNYDDYAHRLQAGRDIDTYSNKSKISLNYVKNDSENLKEAEISNEAKEENAEAFLIANKVRDAIRQGKDYRDIVILSRTSKILTEISMFLELYNIPFYSDSTKFSYEDIELQTFIELLKAIDNDTIDITLLTALKSTIGQFKDEDLAIIRGSNKTHSFNYCFRNFEKNLEENEKDKYKDLIKKINDYNSKMEEYRSISRTNSISDFAWYLLVDSGHMSYVLSKLNGAAILNNIKLFISEISDYEETSFQTLASLIQYIDRMMKQNLVDREPGATLSESDNVVRLMTIHKSKGLQFDTVFLVDLSKRFNIRDLWDKVILNDKYGLSLKVPSVDEDGFVSSHHEQIIIREKKRELYSEELRILYVALTRAISDIYLFGKYNDKLINQNINPKDLKNYNDWISTVLHENQTLSEAIQNQKPDASSSIISIDEVNYEISISNLSTLYEGIDEMLNFEQNSYYELDITQEDKSIKDILAHEYDKSKTDIPFKKTVTEISSKDDNIASDYKKYPKMVEDQNITNTKIKRPEFLSKSKQKKMDALEIGTLYHYILEKIPYDLNDLNDIDNFLLKLINEDFITNEEYEIIDQYIILDFIKSNIYKRIAESENIVKEKAFTMLYNENDASILVDGQIDLYFEENNELILLDFKTNRIIDDEIYKRQLKLYQEGLEKATNKKVKSKLIYWVMHGIVSEID